MSSATADTTPDPELQAIWREWLADRNRRGLRIIAVMLLIFYPLFWLLDFLVVPSELIWHFGALRLTVTVLTAIVFLLSRTEWGHRNYYALGVAVTFYIAWSLMGMVATLGGPHSPYYAGINLLYLVTTLLFLYGTKGAILVYGGVLASWLLLVAIQSTAETLPAAIGNTFFLFTTATVAVVSQFFFHNSLFAQVRANRQVELTKLSLEKAHNDLKQLDKFKSEVFANITHELKTPLAMILAPLELMLNGSMGQLPEAFRASIQSMYKTAVKLLKMIGDILMLTKLEESRLRLRVEEHDMVTYLHGLVGQIRPLAERKELTVGFEANTEHANAWIDLDLLERVFVNLLSNAAKFTPAGGRIDVILEDRGEQIEIVVKDNGPGFPSEMSEKVFDRFFQIDSSATRRHSGVGIGLALSRELVELHSGKIWAESQPGEGAAFHVLLNKAKERLNPEALDRRQRKRDGLAPGRRENDRGMNQFALEGAGDEHRLLDFEHATERRIVERDPDEHQRAYTVLVVEDLPEVIRVIHLTLRHEAKVLAAEDGLKGYELAHSHTPDLIITDLMMPGIDGLELTRRLRESERTRHVPIIMLTARGDLEDRVAGLETGVNAYLTKPFSPRELLTTVRNLLEIQEQAAEIVLSQKMDSLETVAGGLAHEINNPLNYIKNALDLIKTSTVKLRSLAEDAKQRELTDTELTSLKRLETRIDKMFGTAEAGVERIARTVGTMRSYAREGFSRTLREHDAFSAIREVLEVVAPSTGRNIPVELELEGEALVNCVPEELNQVFTNLIQNAIEAVDEQTGKVWIRGQSDSTGVLITVKDNGPGMTAEVRERIFTPFFTTKGPGKGMGMGLTIVWRVVKSIGGTIRVESQPGSGSEFIVKLPSARPATGAFRRAPSAAASAVQSS